MVRAKDGVNIYKLSGTVDEKKQELIIDETGKVLKSGAKAEGKEGKGHKSGKKAGGEKEGGAAEGGAPEGGAPEGGEK